MLMLLPDIFYVSCYYTTHACFYSQPHAMVQGYIQHTQLLPHAMQPWPRHACLCPMPCHAITVIVTEIKQKAQMRAFLKQRQGFSR